MDMAEWFMMVDGKVLQKESAKNMSGKTRLIEPNLDNKSIYQDLINIYQNVYDSN